VERVIVDDLREQARSYSDFAVYVHLNIYDAPEFFEGDRRQVP